MFTRVFLLLSWSLMTVAAPAAEPNKPKALAKGKAPKPFAPGGKYVVGDMERPRPSVTAPPTETTQEKAGMPPGDAIVLFNGTDLSHWLRVARGPDPDKGEDPRWKIEGEWMQSIPGGGGLKCKDRFGSAQLHVEWATPAKVEGKGQGRGNSGILLGIFGEIQVLDSFENDTYPDGQAGALYHKYPPLVNVSRKPGEWQSYDIIIELAKVEAGKAVKPARLTVLHNGIVIHHAIEDDTRQKDWTFGLQDHLNPIRYRNIWVRPLHEYDENAAPPAGTGSQAKKD
jgi:hypothetical protein